MNGFCTSSYSHCPECGQQSMTVGFPCGFGGLQGCMSKQPRRPGSVPFTPAPVLTDEQVSTIVLQLRASLEVPNPSPGVQALMGFYVERINELEEQLEYEKLKADAYRMVWSAREYLRVTQPENYAGLANLSSALNTLEVERVDGVAIREKYNPKVIKLQKRKEYVGPRC